MLRTTLIYSLLLLLCIFPTKGAAETAWVETTFEAIEPIDEVVIAVAWTSDSDGKVYYYALTSTTSNEVAATSIAVTNDIILGDITHSFTWYIEKGEGDISIYPDVNKEKRLYVSSSEVVVGNSTTEKVYYWEINDNWYLYSNSKYIGLKASDIDGNIYLACNKKSFEYQSLVFFKRTTIDLPPLPIQIVEWKTDAIVVMYNGDPSNEYLVTIDKEQSTKQTFAATQKDIAIYEIPIANLSAYANKSLTITVGAQSKTFTIPTIIAAQSNSSSLSSSTQPADLVVLKGGEYSVSTDASFSSINIYGGGKLIVQPSCTLSVSKLNMRVGAVQEGKYRAAYPQLALQGHITNLSDFSIDYLTTYERYYALSTPYPINTATIHYPIDIYGDNVAEDNAGSFQLQYYDGQARAETGQGWNVVKEPATLNPYQGYIFWGAPKKVSVNNTDKQRQTFAIHRLPIALEGIDINTAEQMQHNIQIATYGNEQTPDNDRGWNLIGNPFLTGYQGADIAGDVRYVTTTEDGRNFSSTELQQITLNPFNVYFLQTENAQTMSFTTPHVTNPTRTSVAKQPSDELQLGLILSSDSLSDRTTILIAPSYSEAYEFNADLSKFQNEGLSVYTINAKTRMAYLAVNPIIAAEAILVGYQVPYDTRYTFQLESNTVSTEDIDSVYLYDYEQNTRTNLLTSDYSFYSDEGLFNQRFALSVSFADDQTTPTQQHVLSKVSVTTSSGCIVVNHLPLHADVSIYDALGRRLANVLNSSPMLSLPVVPGYYLVLIRHADSQQSFPIIIH